MTLILESVGINGWHFKEVIKDCSRECQKHELENVSVNISSRFHFYRELVSQCHLFRASGVSCNDSILNVKCSRLSLNQVLGHGGCVEKVDSANSKAVKTWSY